MAFVLLKKPARPVLQHMHPLSRGLQLAWLFQEGGGNKAIDLSGHGWTGNILNSTLGSAWVRGPYGWELSLDGTDDRVSNQTMKAMGVSAYTIVQILKNRTTSGINVFGGISNAVNYGAGERNAGFYADGTTLNFHNRNEPGDTTLLSGTWTTGYHILMATKRGSNIGTQKFGYVDSLTPVTLDNYNENIGPGAVFGVNSDDIGNSWHPEINCIAMMIWNRALTNRELAQVLQDPFINFRPTFTPLFKSPGGTLYTQTLTEEIIISDTIVRHPARTLTEAIPLVDTIIKGSSRTLNETVTVVDTLIKNPEKVLSDAIILVDSILKTPGKVLTESITVVDSIIRDVSRTFSEVITLVDSTIKTTARTLEETITLVDTFVKGRTAILTETITIVDSIERSITHVLTEVITVVDTIIKAPVRTFTEVVTIVDSVVKETARQLNEVITIVDSVLRTIAKTLSETIPIVDSITKSTSRTFSEVVTIVDTITTITGNIYSQILTETIIINDSIVRGVGKVLTETIRIRDTLFKNFVRAIGSWIKKVSADTSWTKKNSQSTDWEQDEGQ